MHMYSNFSFELVYRPTQDFKLSKSALHGYAQPKLDEARLRLSSIIINCLMNGNPGGTVRSIELFRFLHVHVTKWMDVTKCRVHFKCFPLDVHHLSLLCHMPLSQPKQPGYVPVSELCRHLRLDGHMAHVTWVPAYVHHPYVK